MNDINLETILETGTEIIAHAPTIHNDPLLLKVHGYDSGGMWVESEKLTEIAHNTVKDKAEADKYIPIFFVPYAAIRFALAWVPKEASFLREPPVRILS